MTTGTIDESQRRAARVAGAAGLFATALVVAGNFGINERLIVAGDAAQTARNVLEHEGLFRLNVVCDLLYGALVLVLLTALYVILKPVSRGVALVAAFWRLVFAAVWVLMAIQLLGALRLLKAADYLRVFEAERLQALARLNLSAGFDAYYVGLPFFALASTACAYLWLKSRYVPAALAAFGLVGSAWCVACAFAFLVSPGFGRTVNPWWFDTPMALFEIALSFWLLTKGLKPPREATS